MNLHCVFLTEGGRKIGLGHITRCTALAEGLLHFLPQKGFRPVVEFVVSGEPSLKQLFRGEKFTVSFKKWFSSPAQVEHFVRQKDLVVMDSYLASQKIYERVRAVIDKTDSKKVVHPFVCLDDFNRMNYPEGLVIQPTVEGKKAPSPQSVFLSGAEYLILRRDFWAVPAVRPRKQLKRVLLTFGGVPPWGFVQELFDRLLGRFPDYRYDVVLPGKPPPTLLARGKSFHFHAGLTAAHMRELMRRSDLAISAGGQTLFELARVGVPTIAVGFFENQAQNLRFFQREGVLAFSGWAKDKRIFENVLRVVQRLGSQEKRKQVSCKARRLVDGAGVRRIVSRIFTSNA